MSYLDQLVPAPEGWTFHGKALPGEEIYYSNGEAQVFPHPESGWELQFGGSATTIRVTGPIGAFRLFEERKIEFSPEVMAMIETLNRLRLEANALPGGHAYQGKTYGAIAHALEVTVTTAVHDARRIHWTEAQAIAQRLCYEAVDNGEDMAYQIGLWNRGVIAC